jgi:hypothetical protein
VRGTTWIKGHPWLTALIAVGFIAVLYGLQIALFLAGGEGNT